QVLGPAAPVVAVAGEDVVLPCYLKPNISAEDMSVEWTRTHPTDILVHLYQERGVRNENQIPSVRGRTALFPEELKRGNTSLRLRRVQVLDEGRYTCLIQTPGWYDNASVKLHVRAVGSEPVISMEGHRGGGIGLLCESKGWHPEPELTWLDSEGHRLSAEDTETHRDSEGLLTVTRRIVVQETDTKTFTCRVLQQQLKLEKQTAIRIHADMFSVDPWKVTLSVFFTLAVLTLIITAAVIIRNIKLRRKEEWERMYKFAVDVTLDPETANNHLILSEDRKQVRDGDVRKDLSESPKRFDSASSVLGREGFSSGRFYYEVHVGKKNKWTLGVAKESVNRKGFITLSPWHGDKPSTVGVYVDYEGGQVSFYNVGTRSLIYSYTGYVFSQRLYPYFNPCTNDASKNSAPLIISPVRHGPNMRSAIRQYL
ncbi:hypothetical protein AGOR_G00251920, partial [Albula goreensis]